MSRAVLVGAGATAVMDLGAEAIRRVTDVAPLDYALVGRWIGHMGHRQFTHDSIATAPPVPHERALGLLAHYGIGIGFASLLLICRPRWIQRPTFGPAMTVGVGSSLAPFVLMQPAFGMGIAASKTPHPTIARFRTIRGHAIYGIGLYLSGQASARLGGHR